MIFQFLIWTFVLYSIHRAAHIIPIVRDLHWDHHQQVIDLTVRGWHWSNLFLFNDTWRSTADLWITEVIPTILFAAVFECWWIVAFYYLWAAFIQELIEHNPNFDAPILTSGKWHLIHHRDPSVNFGLFFPLWDYVFGTNHVVQSQSR